MKNVISGVLLSIAIFFVSIPSMASSDNRATLSVTNLWTAKIKVSEGIFLTMEQEVLPGRAFSRPMVFTNSITYPHVKYEKDGAWVSVLGCPSLSYPEGISVVMVVEPMASNPAIPVCRQSTH
ncbi:MAG: hypothetical protein JSS53_08365 [Proteobacteria bacterium]|nr:hypothetical protein [Pseudomonadota bacterium]